VATKRTDSCQPVEASEFARQLGKRHAFDVMEEELFVCMLRTIDRMSANSNSLFAKHQISGPLYNALRIIGGESKFTDEGLTVGTIASRLVCRSPDTTRLIDRLVKLGYAKCDICSQDARRRLVTITERGTKVLQDLHRPLRDMHRQHFRVLSLEERNRLLSLLEKLRSSLSGDEFGG
jgi:DNA-binding MarR family transcriptional regulator